MNHHLTASLAAAHIDDLLSEARQRRLATEVRRSRRSREDETFGERPRRRRFPRLITA